jgi:MFS family permease
LPGDARGVTASSAIPHPEAATIATTERFAWPVVLACFSSALFAWGFGFYGQAVYLAVLQKSQGWSIALISSATTVYYLAGAVLIALVPDVIDRFGPRAVIIGGALVLACGTLGLAASTAPWQLFAANLVMAAGWAATSTTAITTTIALWFDRRRGLAISLALNGASAAGFTVAPALVYLSDRYALSTAVAIVAASLLLALVTIVLLALRPSPAHGAAERRPIGGATPDQVRSKPVLQRRADALRSWHFWTVAAPFALALVAQVGFIVHQVAFLSPKLGIAQTGGVVALGTIAAVIGRVGLGLVIDRLNQRAVAAASFASQSVGLLILLGLGDHPAALYVGCILFGLSVGNVITLPSLIVQREFAAASFGLVVGLSTAIGQFAYAFAPALLGVIHDAAGGYGPTLALCVAFQLAAAVIVVRGKPTVIRS